MRLRRADVNAISDATKNALPRISRKIAASFGRYQSVHQIAGDADHPFAAVFAGEQSDQSGRCLVEAVDDVFGNFRVCLRRSTRARSFSACGSSIDVVHHDEALHLQAFRYQQSRYAARAGRRIRRIVLRNDATTDDAALQIHARKRRFENRSAGVVEIDVDAGRDTAALSVA